ncbi:MAG: succinate dehydrogenase, cytochrome b556 subunit [Alphaproteobacteria bacterium]|nr:succinate dehydrogenase, cytochrome b556 subunit [Alphaproteobacteria bacterium]
MSESSSTPRTKSHERPLSPHLTIYKPQITSMLSISHRISGVLLSAGLVVFVAWLWCAAYCPEYYTAFSGYATSWWGMLLLLMWSFAFNYHFLNGIRHLFWDMGEGLELEPAIRSGWIVVVGTFAITGLYWWAIMVDYY